jgi:hypothetical protein
MADWRYIARRMNGDGTSTMLDPDLPLSGVNLTTVLSGPAAHQSHIAPAVARLVGPDGEPIIQRGSTAIFAEQDGSIEHGCIVTNVSRSGPDLAITGTGFSGYAAGKNYDGDKFFIQTDPLDIVRHAWAHIQGRRNMNIGLVLGGAKVGVLIGTKLDQVEFDTQAGPVSFEAGPFKLNWWQTDDLGGVIDDLATTYGFDYKESHAWAAGGVDEITHRLDFGVPRIGVRRADQRFVVGENVTAQPTESFDADSYATDVYVRGAGEGRTMIRGYAARTNDPRLARPVTIEDKNIKSVKEANARAAAELAQRSGYPTVSEIVVRDSSEAPIGALSNGDEIELHIDGEWGARSDWYRILSTTFTPEDLSVAKYAVVRADTLPS